VLKPVLLDAGGRKIVREEAPAPELAEALRQLAEAKAMLAAANTPVHPTAETSAPEVTAEATDNSEAPAQ
jgi:hypothetical protein